MEVDQINDIEITTMKIEPVAERQVELQSAVEVPETKNHDILSKDSSDEEESEGSYLSSGTSSYDSDHGGAKGGKVGKPKEESKETNPEDKVLMEMMQDEFDEPSISSYTKFKTQNEIDPELVEKYAPPMPTLDDLDEVIEFGTVSQFIDESH